MMDGRYDMTLKADATKPIIRLKKLYLIILFFFLLAPIWLVPFMFSGFKFIPSPSINMAANWFGAVIGGGWALLLGASSLFIILGKNCISPISGKPYKWYWSALGAFFMFIVMANMTAQLSQTVIGHFLHERAPVHEQCNFSRTIEKTRQVKRWGKKIHHLNIKGSEDLPLVWLISETEYYQLPSEFDATILATQSKFGVKIDDYVVHEGRLPKPDPPYQKECTEEWGTKPARERNSIVFYWY